jgi:hypothetical protein
MWQPVFARLQEVVVEEGLPWRAEVIKIRDQADSYRHKFVGSLPSAWMAATSTPTLGRGLTTDLGCRSYQDEGKISGLPSKEMLRS